MKKPFQSLVINRTIEVGGEDSPTPMTLLIDAGATELIQQIGSTAYISLALES